jgi:uncharacterized protein
MDFEWDPAKAAANLAKHGIDFPSASRVFDDPAVVELRSRLGLSQEAFAKRFRIDPRILQDWEQAGVFPTM